MDPYIEGLFRENPYSKKRIIECSIVAVLQSKLDKRTLHLIPPISRALKKNEIHELIVTYEKDAKPGTFVNHVSYLAFIEINRGGIMVVGDEVYRNNDLLGTVVGFDDTHMPNHQNIILYSPERKTGKELNINLEDLIIIQSNQKRNHYKE